jgi:alpha,alpha-trehalase
MPLLGFLPPGDERIRRTVLAIADELTEDGLVLRYRVEETDDGLSARLRQPARALRRGGGPPTGRHLGNFPQAFTHLALITPLMEVIRAEQRPAERGGALSSAP